MTDSFHNTEFALPVTAAFLSLRSRGKFDDHLGTLTLVGSTNMRTPLGAPFDAFGFGRLQEEAGSLLKVAEFGRLLQRLGDLEWHRESPPSRWVTAAIKILQKHSCE